MKTAEQELLDQPKEQVIERQFKNNCDYGYKHAKTNYFIRMAFESGFDNGMGYQKYSNHPDAAVSKWIPCSDKCPDLIDGKDYSENVLAIINGQLGVACYCWVYDGETGGYLWGDCYGNIDGECEIDNEYTVTHWQPLPEKPQI